MLQEAAPLRENSKFTSLGKILNSGPSTIPCWVHVRAAHLGRAGVRRCPRNDRVKSGADLSKFLPKLSSRYTGAATLQTNSVQKFTMVDGAQQEF